MNNDELIAAGHELAKCLDSNTPLLDIAKMIVRLADKLDVTTLALREKTKQCEQLAAENEAQKWLASRSLLKRQWKNLTRLKPQPLTHSCAKCGHKGVEAAIEAAKPWIAYEFQRQTYEQCVAVRGRFPQTDMTGQIEFIEWLELWVDELRQGGAA